MDLETKQLFNSHNALKRSKPNSDQERLGAKARSNLYPRVGQSLTHSRGEEGYKIILQGKLGTAEIQAKPHDPHKGEKRALPITMATD